MVIMQESDASPSLADAQAPVLRTELPGPAARDWVARDQAVSSPSLPRAYPVVPARARGCVIEDVDGNLLLDFNAGIAVTATGHAHPRVLAAIESQARQYLHYSASDFFQTTYVELCERLAGLAPFSGPARVLLANSGTEGVEAAVKLARHATGRPNVIAFYGGFHGRTLGSLALTASKASHRRGLGPFMAGVHHAPYGSCSACMLDQHYPACELACTRHFEEVLFRHVCPPEEVAAVVVEPILGEGGYVVPPPGWLATIAELCRRHGILLIADEVQSGIGRTGTMWAVQHDAVEPDIVVAAKGLASGLPVAAVIGRAELFNWPRGRHGSTFGGNPLACAAALVTLDLVESELAANAATMGEQLLEGLRGLQRQQPLLRDVRGRGLMVGVEFEDGSMADAVEQGCFQHGLLVLTCGQAVVRFAPPLVVRSEQIDRAIEILSAVCDELAPAAH